MKEETSEIAVLWLCASTRDNLVESIENLLKLMEQFDFMQIVETTDEEKTAMYMKCTKKQLIKMLIQCNKIIDKYVKPTPVYPINET